jgi:hypothetical protein
MRPTPAMPSDLPYQRPEQSAQNRLPALGTDDYFSSPFWQGLSAQVGGALPSDVPLNGATRIAIAKRVGPQLGLGTPATSSSR